MLEVMRQKIADALAASPSPVASGRRLVARARRVRNRRDEDLADGGVGKMLMGH
jgi:hypothetical protein